MSAGPLRRFENDDVVAALHQLVAAAQSADATAGDDDALRRPRLQARDRKRHGGRGELQSVASGQIPGGGCFSVLVPSARTAGP